MSNLYSRVQDIEEKIKQASLSILQWRVLFAINDSTDFSTIQEFTEETDDNIQNAINELTAIGFIYPAESDVESPAVSTQAASRDFEAPSQESKTSEIKPIETIEDETIEMEEESEDIELDHVEPIDEKAVEDIISETVENDIEVTEDEDEEISVMDMNSEFEIANPEEIVQEEIAREPQIESPEIKTDTSPVLEEKNEEVPATTVKTDSGASNKIVVADDSIVIRKMVELALEDNGFEVIGYSKAKDLLDNLDKDKPAIAIIDLSLSDMNGVEVLLKIKNTKGIPVLMFASKTSPADMEKAESSGCDGFIQKPFKDEDLLEKVKSLA